MEPVDAPHLNAIIFTPLSGDPPRAAVRTIHSADPTSMLIKAQNKVYICQVDGNKDREGSHCKLGAHLHCCPVYVGNEIGAALSAGHGDLHQLAHVLALPLLH